MMLICRELVRILNASVHHLSKIANFIQKGGVRSQIFAENEEYSVMLLTKSCHCATHAVITHNPGETQLWSLSHNSHYATIRSMENLANGVEPHGLEFIVGTFENSNQGRAEEETFDATVINVQRGLNFL